MLSIIIPCYNEQSRLPVETLASFILENRQVMVCLVNDASKDNTLAMLYDLKSKISSQVQVLNLEKNVGKGEAVRAGIMFMQANFSTEYICFLDADFSTPLYEALRLYNLMISYPGLLCVFGSRISIFGNKIRRSVYRHYSGRVIATIIDLILKLGIYDTQCGLKIFKTNLASEIFKQPFISRWLFDVEIFARIKQRNEIENLNVILKEVPLDVWEEKGASKITLFDIFRLPFIFLNIYVTYRLQAVSQADSKVKYSIRKEFIKSA